MLVDVESGGVQDDQRRVLVECDVNLAPSEELPDCRVLLIEVVDAQFDPVVDRDHVTRKSDVFPRQRSQAGINKATIQVPVEPSPVKS